MIISGILPPELRRGLVTMAIRKPDYMVLRALILSALEYVDKFIYITLKKNISL